ncbi:DeoR/GlpR family DNA-binding transcription regulator [Olsenella sp. Marseille-P4559]|uniref:DeoR/GlpR family DNA-binding transcription regulator n=1 Tax=Olsenella sp. Marseille-P4559 TaxID=2364795 RepID=UPI0010302E63|nr:DeoR/GlpR family DNA-binding transcription regulator [Olsenella sp. Marseille-P4559]
MPPEESSPAERQSFILEWLDSNPSIAVSDIRNRFGVSDVTVRHDLIALESAGRVRRVRGGAVSLARTMLMSYPEERINFNVEAKDCIARSAAGLVEDGDVIIADIGTTAYQFVRHLVGKKGITIITGDLSIAHFASFNLPNAEVMLLGGKVRKEHLYLAGAMTLDSMSKLYADRAFLSCDGFHRDHGFTVEHDFSMTIKQTYIANSRQSVMMLDSSKFGRTSFYRFSALDDYDVVVTDSDEEGYLSGALKKSAHAPQLVIASKAASDGPGAVRGTTSHTIWNPTGVFS